MGQTSIIVCPSKLIFHISCPGCGITRATLFVLQGQFMEALCLNPNVVFAIVFLFLYPCICIYDALTKRQLLPAMYSSLDSWLKRPWVFILFGLFEIGIWIHNIVCHI